MSEFDAVRGDDSTAPARVVMTGSSGLIGTEVAGRLRANGYEVVRLVRRAPRAVDEVQWMNRDVLDPRVVDGAAAVINLSGASIARLPWTASYRHTLRDSRLRPTRMLSAAIAAAESAPHFVSASASGIYGSSPGLALTENAVRGEGFLATLCADWEDAASEAGDRVTHLRTSPVVHRQAILKPLAGLAKAGLAGPVGPGTQHWGWISLPDAADAIVHVVARAVLGPVNLNGPTAVTANDFIRQVARVLRRPFLLPAPSFAVRALLGADFADAMLLADQHIVPTVLNDTGFTFTHRSASTAIASELD